VVTVEPVKAREVEEPEAFIVSLIDEGGDSPIEMRLESFMGNARPESSKGTGATTVIVAYSSNQPDHTAKRAEILDFLESRGVTKRTGEQAIEELWRKGRIHPVKRGYWQVMA
jgi:hypothetical protein